MKKLRVIVIFSVTFIVFFLYYIVKCQQPTKTAAKNAINLRNIRNRNKKNSNNNDPNRNVNKLGNNKKNKINGKNNNKIKKRNKKVKGKGRNNNNGGDGNYGNNTANNNYNDNGFLSIQNGNLVYKKKIVFISGVNILFISIGKDFGNGGYASVKTQYESWLKEISDAGGNAVRILVHGNGVLTPKLDSDGYATGEHTASLAQELAQFLDTAHSYNVFVFITFWSGSLSMTALQLGVYQNEAKLDRYMERVLKPLVSALKTKKALAAYEVISTPQVSVVTNIADTNPCFDTRFLFHYHKPINNTNNVTMKQMQTFINKQLDAIKIADPKALRSLITKEEEASDYCDWCYNYWQDKCLIAAGGKQNGILDYYGFDAVAFSGQDYYWSPLRKKAADYKLDKPIMIAMTSGMCSDSKSIVTNFNHALDSGYCGAFGWRYSPGSRPACDDSSAQCDDGMRAVKNNDMIKIIMN